MKVKHEKKYLSGFLISFLLASNVQAKPEKAAGVNWYVNINRALMHASDGFQKDTYFVDNTSQSTRAGLSGEKSMDACTKVGGKLELEFVSASSSAVSQLNKNASSVFASNTGAGTIQTDPTENLGAKIRQADTWISGEFGKLSLGHGSMAAWTAVASDLSGTAATISTVGNTTNGGGLYFHQQGSAAKVVNTDPQVNTVFSAYDGLGSRQSRVRYDSPVFAGFSLSGFIYGGAVDSTIRNTANYVKYVSDLALRYNHSFSGVKVQAAVSGARSSKADKLRNGKVFNGSLAALHESSGLNIALNFGSNKPDTFTTGTNEKTKKLSRVQLGLISKLNSYGPTKFVVDYAHAKHAVENDSKGKAYGLGVVQELKKINSEAYVTVRQMKFEKTVNAQKYDKIKLAMAGLRVSFAGKL